MNQAVNSRMFNTANSLINQSSVMESDSISKETMEFLNRIESLLIDIKKEHKDFNFDNWIYCNKLKGKSEREIYFSLSEQYDKNFIENKKCLSLLNKSSSLIKNAFSNHGYPTDSLSDFFQEVKQSIVAGKNDYLDILKDIFSSYMDYVRELREAMASLGKYTKAGKKDGYIAVNFIEFKNELEKIRSDYINKFKNKPFFKSEFKFEYNNEGYIRNIEQQKINYSNKSQVDHALNSVEKLLMNIKGIKIVKHDNSTKTKNDINIDFWGDINFDDFDKIINGVKEKIPDKKILTNEEIESKKNSIIDGYRKELSANSLFINSELKKKIESGFEARANEEIKRLKKERDEEKFNNMLQTEFDLLKKSIDAFEKKLSNNLDELSKKYSSANSNYDNFVKIMSSTMNTLLEMAKGFLRF
jgi:invasin D